MRLGAAGKTAQELDALLGTAAVPSSSSASSRLEHGRSHEDTTLLASSIWLDEKAKPRGAVLARCEACGVPVTRTRLSSPEAGAEISRWINQKTNGMLSPQVEPDAEALVCLVSALYFKGTWRDTFERSATERMPFHAPQGDVHATFMRQTGDFRVLDLDVATVLALPFAGGSKLMLALPSGSGTPDDLLSNAKLLGALAHFVAPEIYANVNIPKFSCTTTIKDMTAQLAHAGFANAGTPDLSPLTGAANTPTSYVHGTRFSIDEEGAEGSSYFLGMAAGCIPQEMPEPRVIVFDRPFVFALVSSTGQPLFIGRVDQPQADEYSWHTVQYECEQLGPTGHMPIRGEFVPGLARIQMEQDWETGEYFITCEVKGVMSHLHVCNSHTEAERDYAKMRAELLLCARRMKRDACFDLEAWRDKFQQRW
jgi:serpin B